MNFLKTIAKLTTPPVWLLICLVTLPQISETIYSPALPDIADSLLTTMTWAKWTLSIYFFGFAIGVGIWGKISDHIGRRPSALIGLTIYILTSLGCATIKHIYPLLIFRFFQAFGISIGSIITQTIMRDCFSGTRRNKIFSMAGAMIGISPAIGPVIGGFAVKFWHWQSNFIILMLLGILLGLATLFYLPETKPKGWVAIKENSYCSLIIRMLKDPHILASAILVGGFNGLLFSYYAHAPFIFIDIFKLTPNHYGYLGIFMALAVTIGSLLSYRIASHYNSFSIVKTACLINLIGMVLYVILAFFNILSIGNRGISITLIMVIMMIFYVTFGISIPNILSKALSNYQDIIGTAGSILGLIYYFIVSIILLGIGWIKTYPVKGMAIYYCFIAVIMLFSTWFLKNDK